MREWKRYYLMRVIMTVLFAVGVGCLFLALRRYADEVFDVLLIAAGLGTVAMNLPRFVVSLFHVRYRGEWINLLLASASIALGVLLMLLRRDVLLLILGIFSLVMPAVRVALVTERKEQLRREVPCILFGIFMIVVSLTKTEQLIFTGIGFALLGFALLYLLYGIVMLCWRFPKVEKDEEAEEKK